MRIIGVMGGNGVILYPMRKYLIGNIETRSNFKTPNDIQWKLNFGEIPLITKIKEFPNFPEIDVIVGAPNCGHSSMLSYSRAKTTSNPLDDKSFDIFLKSIKQYRPKVFMMENLPKILESLPYELWNNTFPEYHLIWHIESVHNWGNSQGTRIRLVLIGLRTTYFKENISNLQYHFSYVYKINELKYCKDLLQDLPENGNFRENISDIITMYAGFKISLKKAQEFWLNNPKLKRWLVSNKKFTTAPGVYRNPDDQYPAVARKANRQFNSQGLQMTPRELARIQGIPDTFKIYFDPNKKIYSINKGRITVTKTPPYEIARWFYKQLKKSESWM